MDWMLLAFVKLCSSGMHALPQGVCGVLLV